MIATAGVSILGEVARSMHLISQVLNATKAVAEPILNH